MSYALTYFDQVKQDLKEAKAWYKNQQPDLDKRFAGAIKMAIEKLQEFPFSYAVRYKHIRVAHPKIFPYGIHFYIDEPLNRIVIVAIVHNKRHPDVAMERV